MHRVVASFVFVALACPLFAQNIPNRQNPRTTSRVMYAESAIKQAMEALVEERKIYERDVAVLREIRQADDALTDPMQPSNAIQKAYDHIDKAKTFMPELVVMATHGR